MTARPVLVAQISDLHIKPPGQLAYGRVDTAAALERCVAGLNEFRPRPDIVVISGDLADTPTAEEYEHLKSLLAVLELPFVSIPGNHDSREMMRAVLPQAFAFPMGPLNQKVEIRELDLVLLDSSVHGRMANSMRRPCNGSSQFWQPHRSGRRCYSCTIRRSRRGSGIWTGRTFSMPENWRWSSGAIRACS